MPTDAAQVLEEALGGNNSPDRQGSSVSLSSFSAGFSGVEGVVKDYQVGGGHACRVPSCSLRWCCMRRYVNQLDPHLKAGVPFSAWEQAVIVRAQEVHPNKWALMASMLPGRSDNAIKNVRVSTPGLQPGFYGLSCMCALLLLWLGACASVKRNWAEGLASNQCACRLLGLAWPICS